MGLELARLERFNSSSAGVESYRDPLQLRFIQQVVEFILGGFNLLWVSSIHHVATTGSKKDKCWIQVQDWKQFSSERTVLPYCTTGCILTQPMTMAITHTASQRCMQPKPSAHSSKKKTKHGPSHQPAASTHCTVSLRLAGHSEDGHCRSTSCALPLSHHHMTMSTVSQLSEEDFHWAFCALARLSLSPRSCMASVELISHRTRDNSFTHLHNSTDSSTVTLPHAPEARLTADVPQLQRERVHSEDTQTMVQ